MNQILTPKIKNALKMLAAGLVLLALAMTVFPLALILAIPLVPYMIYKGFIGEDAPFPKPWDLPKY